MCVPLPPTATSGVADKASLSCTGSATNGTVSIASAPSGWLSHPVPGGSVRVQGATTAAMTLQHGGATTAQLPSGVAGNLTATGGLATGLVASQAWLDDGTTARGLNVSSCAAPVQDGWFFGGGNEAGRVARVTLVNPGATPSTVNVTVIGASGVDRGTTVTGVVLAPGERHEVTLGNFGSSLSAAAVHVTATGAGVVTALTDAWMTGETPVGEDTVSDPVTPAKSLVISGVSATTAAPTVRLAVPGGDQAIVRVQAVDGPARSPQTRCRRCPVAPPPLSHSLVSDPAATSSESLPTNLWLPRR